MISYDICLSLSDLLHLVWSPLGSSVLLQIALFASFLWMSSIAFGEGNGNPLQYSCLGNPMNSQSMGSQGVGHDWSDLARTQYSIGYMHHIFIHSSVAGHLGCFHVLAVLNNAAVNIEAHVSFQIIVLSGYVPRSGVAGSYGNSTFSLFEELPYYFP